MTPAVEQIVPGDELLPGYQVVGLLRRGRRLDTFDAYDVKRDCRVVVKAIRPDRRHEPEPVAALLREGCLLRDLAHPHLVRCYDVIEEPVPAIILETLGGAMLSAVIEDRRLTVHDTAQLGLQLVSALNYLHLHGWLHLDVKPSNIAVSAGRATLIDLSLAGQPGCGTPGAGTPGYLAPEQAAGEGLGPATDVFGLGVTLGECLTGSLAFGQEATWDTGRLLRRRLRRPSRPFTRRIARLPAAWSELLLGCLEPEPDDRPTITQLRQRLAELEGSGISR
jgi:serine/threonine protein kinase